jgi:hypothetical protein
LCIAAVAAIATLAKTLMTKPLTPTYTPMTPAKVSHIRTSWGGVGRVRIRNMECV